MTIKWGVIGAGGIADRRIIPDGIIPARNADLVALMDLDGTKAKALAKKYGGVKYYMHEEDLLNDPEIEVVYIATPLHLHYRQTCMAAKAKKHVLCEKPMALNVKQCEGMLKACTKNGVKLGIGLMMRFHAYHRHLKKIVEQGELGRIVMGRAQLSCWYPPIEGAWRQNLKLSGGGALMDMGPHCIDLLEMIIGKVTDVSCIMERLVHRYKPEDSAAVMLHFKNGALGFVDTFFNIPDSASKNSLEIYGSKGSVLARGTIGQMPDGEMTAFLERDAKEYNAKQERKEKNIEIKISPDPVNIFQAEIEHFSQCIEEDKKPLVSGEDGLRNLTIINACYESAKTGKMVKVK